MDNSSEIAHGVTNILATVGVIAIGVPALALNVLVVIFSIKFSALKGKDYRIFLLNQAIVDIIFTLQSVISASAIARFVDWCSWGGPLNTLTAGILIHGLAPVCFNRYVAVCKPQWTMKVFGSVWKKGVVLAYPYWMGFLTASCAMLLGVYSPDRHGLMCLASLQTQLDQAITHAAMFSGVCLAYAIVGYCTICLRRKLKQLESSQEFLAEHGRLAETRYLLKAIIAQAIIPIAGQIPLSIYYTTNMFFDLSLLEIGGILTFLLCPLLDAITTLAIVKPYRQAALEMKKKIFPTRRTVPICASSTSRNQGN